ncbi:MAG TPA: 30S ribosomal protein S20 [Rickettsiales bacterium]|nr:30S ribosomal protein S20 [Rickettsiales bacterium]
MANVSSSKKAIRVIERKTEINKARRSRIKTFLRKVNDTITTGTIEDARKAFVEFESELMKGVKNGILKKNTASRKLSRLAGHIKKMDKKA